MTDTADILQFCSYTCLVLAGLMLIISVILFFKFKIRDTIYELSGKARVSSTQKMQSSYTVTGSLRSGSITGSGALNSSETGSRSDDLSSSLIMTDTLMGKTQKTIPSGGKQSSRKRSETGNIKKSSQLGSSKQSYYQLTKDVIVIHTDERIAQ